MITWKDIQFENNPNGMNELVQWKGDIVMQGSCWVSASVFGITEGQIMDIARQFKEIEPRAFEVVIYGPTDFLGIRREYVRTTLL